MVTGAWRRRNWPSSTRSNGKPFPFGLSSHELAKSITLESFGRRAGETMLTLQDRAYRFCDGLTRREWLRVGALGLFALSLPLLLAPRWAPAPVQTTGKAKSCIVLFLFGGPPQHE